MKNWSIIIACAIGILLLQSCKDAYDFSMDNLSSTVEQQSDFALPLVDASITLKELLPNDDGSEQFLLIDNNNFITLIFEQDITQVTAGDFFDGDYLGPSLPFIEYDVEPHVIELGMDQLLNEGTFYLADPKATIIIKNYWNVATRFMFKDFYYYEDATSSAIAVTGPALSDWVTVAVPAAPGGFAITEIILDRTTSNIDEVVSALPHHLSFGADFETIPGGAFDVEPGSIDSVKLKIEVPMDLRIENLAIIDTISFSLGDNLDEDTTVLQSLELSMVVNNGFPLDLSTQIYFVDENYTILDSISATGINVTAGNSTNGTNSPVETLNTILVENSKISNLVKSKYLIPKFVLNTKGAALNETVKLYSTYAIGLKLGARIKLKIKI